MSPSTGGQRDWVQVVCNSGVASAAALLYIYLFSAGMHGELPLKLSPVPVGTVLQLWGYVGL